MATTQELVDGTRRYVPDIVDEPDTTGRREAAVTAALLRFSRDVPRIHAQSITANPQAVSGLTDGWEDEFSEVIEIEWPYLTASAGIIDKQLVVDGEGKPRYTVDRESDDSYKLRFPGTPIGAGSAALIRYTKSWTAADLSSVWEDAVSLLAAALFARALSGVYEGGVSPAVGGVTILDASGKATSYGELADQLEALYLKTIGKEEAA